MLLRAMRLGEPETACPATTRIEWLGMCRPQRPSRCYKGEFARTLAVGNLLFDRWTADDLHELACLARDARDAKLEGFMRGEEVQPTGRITARIACYQHAVDWDEIDPRLERRLSAVEKRYLAERIGQNRVAAGKPRDSHNL